MHSNDIFKFKVGTFILVDNAYPLIVPYKDIGHLIATKKRFNMKQFSENLAEHGFDRLRQRSYLKLRDSPRMIEFVHACCILHNLADANDMLVFGTLPADDLDVPLSECPNDQVRCQARSESALRDELCRTVNTKGR